MLNIASHRFRTAAPGLTALAILLTAGCTLSKDEAPALSGPSTFGISINASASPDALPRDGASTSVVRFSVRDSADQPVAGQRLTLTTTAGTLSATDVTTNSAGDVAVQLTAPALSSTATSARVMATPI